MKQLLSYLQQELPAALQLLEKMVNMESPSTDKPLVDRFARFVGSEFKAIGGAVDYVPAERFGDHLRVRFEGKSGDRILLLGHSDTVFPVGEVAKRPFRIQDGRATGPGVFDMKAGILLMWSALRGLLHIEKRLAHSITVLLTSDEEVGSAASRALLESEAGSAKAVPNSFLAARPWPCGPMAVRIQINSSSPKKTKRVSSNFEKRCSPRTESATEQSTIS